MLVKGGGGGDKQSITKPHFTRHAGKAGGLLSNHMNNLNPIPNLQEISAIAPAIPAKTKSQSFHRFLAVCSNTNM